MLHTQVIDYAQNPCILLAYGVSDEDVSSLYKFLMLSSCLFKRNILAMKKYSQGLNYRQR
jgi:hypothetical protein